MIDYLPWPTKRLSVTSLLLDQENPRLPQFGGSLAQRQIIDELVIHDDVYELAKGISTQGFFPTEVLLGVRDGDQIVIIEGNRRLAALKLLINPELAPQTHLERFRRLAEKITATVISKVQVSISPSRAAAPCAGQPTCARSQYSDCPAQKATVFELHPEGATLLLRRLASERYLR